MHHPKIFDGGPGVSNYKEQQTIPRLTHRGLLYISTNKKTPPERAVLIMVPVIRLELTTFALRMHCSTS